MEEDVEDLQDKTDPEFSSPDGQSEHNPPETNPDSNSPDGRWLNDKHNVMYAAQHLLKSQFPHISGLQPTFLGKAHQWKVMTSEGVKIINQSNSHWICLSTIGCAPDTAYFYDSMLYNKSCLHPQVTKDIVSPVHAAGDCIDVMVPQSQLQVSADDCGLFAIATATFLCFGIPLSTILCDQKKMREHLRRCFENGKMSPFPGWDLLDRRKIIPHISDEPLLTTVKVNVYCSCKMPQVGRERMAQCTKCLKWYHKRCENITKTVFCKSKKTSYCCKYH